MPLSKGDQLGPYEIISLIGKGGMGEVYRARDTKLARDVAIKVLPAAVARDPERLTRFEREAKVLASLNHPNIAQIYGVEAGGLVMELVEGESLQGPIPVETALHYARQIAEALEAAHEKGITHRDLKPANIMITPAEVVKVLDFGLAAVAQDPTSDSSDPTISPTLTIGATQAGMIMGTAAYMSPEQAAGKTVDKRADIWSFGVVLWEMLTGHRLFDGETISHTLADVLRCPIDFDKLPTETPRAIRNLLQRCLDRDLKNRLRDIGEARVVLGRIGKEPETLATAPSQSRLGRIAWIVAGVLAVAAAGGFAGWYRATRTAQQKPLVRLEVDLGPGVSVPLQGSSNAILSPDGSRLVYMAQRRLMTRRLDQAKATELPGTGSAINPFFSPDSQWVAFFSQGKLQKISVGGGAVIPLADAVGTDTRGASWAEDGSIIAALTSGGGLSRIPAGGGVPTAVTERAPGEVSHSWPQILPGGKAVLFSANTARLGWDGANIEVISLPDRRRKTLQRGGTFGRYLPTSNGAGYLLYISRGTLFAVPFDVGKLEIRGTPVPVLEEVAYNPFTGSAQFDFSGGPSDSGTLIYRSGVTAGLLTFQWLDNGGKTQPLLVKPGEYAQGRLSPDGQRLALTVTEGSNTDVWVYDWQRDTMARLTSGGSHGYPVWTPDGRFVIFSTAQAMYWTRADGGGKPHLLIQEGGLAFSFTPDGKTLAFQARGSAGGRFDIWTVPIENDGVGLNAGKRVPFLQTDFDEREPTFSPDGRWLAYSSDESGTFQVYVRPFPEASTAAGGKWQVSNGSGMYPQWSRTAHELFFRTYDTQMITVAPYAVKGDSFAPGKPQSWSERQLADIGNVNYDLAPDGKRVAALMPAEEAGGQQPSSHVTFLLNFFDELRRHFPQ